MFWKKTSNSKGGPGDLDSGFGGGFSSPPADDDVAVLDLPEDFGGGSAPDFEDVSDALEAGTGVQDGNSESAVAIAPLDLELEAGLVTTDRRSSWRRVSICFSCTLNESVNVVCPVRDFCLIQ